MADEAVPTNDGSLESAAAALSEARKEAQSPEPADTAPAATDSTPQEMPDASPETHDATPEDNPDTVTTTIAYPPGWNAEDQAWFDTLEPARQEAILRREKGTQAAESRRQNEHQAALKAAQEAAEQAAQERQYLQSSIQHYKHPIETAYRKQFADVISGQMDLFHLSQTDRWATYQAFQAEFSRIGQVEQQLAQRAEHEEQARLSQHIEARNNQIIDAKPELKDPAKFQQFDADVTTYLRDLKIPDERIARVSFEELQIVEKAMLWDRAQKAKANVPKPQLQTKPGQVAIPGHVRSLPRVMRPGASGSGGGNDERKAAIDQRARQTGSVDDAAERLRIRRQSLQRA